MTYLIVTQMLTFPEDTTETSTEIQKVKTLDGWLSEDIKNQLSGEITIPKIEDDDFSTTGLDLVAASVKRSDNAFLGEVIHRVMIYNL